MSLPFLKRWAFWPRPQKRAAVLPAREPYMNEYDIATKNMAATHHTTDTVSNGRQVDWQSRCAMGRVPGPHESHICQVRGTSELVFGTASDVAQPCIFPGPTLVSSFNDRGSARHACSGQTALLCAQLGRWMGAQVAHRQWCSQCRLGSWSARCRIPR